MKTHRFSAHVFLFSGCAIFFAGAMSTLGAISTTVTNSNTTLRNALNPSGLTPTVSKPNGEFGQFGTYTNFSLGPVTIANGVALSSGDLTDIGPLGPHDASDPPPNVNTDMDAGGTTEFDNYGLGSGNIENFEESFDVAAMKVTFTLAAPAQVQFDFVFGSVEYPEYTGDFTDAFLVFLDGTAPSNQIVTDGSGNAVQVGSSFASQLTTADQNTAFADPHGMLNTLTTTTPLLGIGTHFLQFEVGDVNDGDLDSVAFIANLRTGVGVFGTTASPEPASMLLFTLGGMALLRRRRGN